MIEPAGTSWPSPTFTPRRWPTESRPFFELEPAFLWAIGLLVLLRWARLRLGGRLGVRRAALRLRARGLRCVGLGGRGLGGRLRGGLGGSLGGRLRRRLAVGLRGRFLGRGLWRGRLGQLRGESGILG